MLLTKPQITELAYLGRISDREIRSDLSLGLIATENDYTSNFTGAFRRNINCYSKTGLTATSVLARPQLERMAGIDATILLSNATATKVIFFEAKWPRFGTAYHSWDHAQTASGLSHFSDQLDRQAQVSASFAVFEMFYVEYPFGRQPPFLFDEWSSCVWHDDAIRFRNSRSTPSAIWTQNDCKNLIITKNYDIGAVLANVAMCAKGVPIRSAKPEEVVQEFQLGGNVLAIRGGDGRD